MAHRIDLVCLAGFMRLLTPWFVGQWQGRMLNIHPALLPAFKGLHTHERALADGVKIHGATVHFVSAEIDSGPIILQAEVPVIDGDTPETLAARVLEAEHRHLSAGPAQSRARRHLSGRRSRKRTEPVTGMDNPRRSGRGTRDLLGGRLDRPSYRVTTL